MRFVVICLPLFLIACNPDNKKEEIVERQKLIKKALTRSYAETDELKELRRRDANQHERDSILKIIWSNFQFQKVLEAEYDSLEFELKKY